MFKTDPGQCPICGAAHTACRSDAGPIRIVQLPNRDAAEVKAPELVAEQLQPSLPPSHFTTATYRGKKGESKK